MKSKASFRQQSRPVVRILNVTLTTVAIMLALSGSSLAQSRLPFLGTRTFCGEHSYQLRSARDSDPKLQWETKTTVTIRANGFTTVKTNAFGPPYEDARRSTPYPYVTFSGKLTPGKANTMEKGEMRPAMAVCGLENCLWFSSASDIEVSSDWGTPDKAALCTSEAAPLKKSDDVQRNPAASTNAGSNPPPGGRAQSTLPNQIAPDTLVANLYRQDKQIFQQARSRVLLDKYFDKSLADLIWKAQLRWKSSGDSEIEDFDYVLYNFGIGSDVSSVSKPIISKPTYEAQKAQINVSYVVVCAPPACAKKSVDKETIIFLLAAGETGWRITDIKYDCRFDWCIHGEKISLFEMYSRDSKATDAEREYWTAIPCCDNVQGYKDYLQKYPNGVYVSVARAKIREIESGKKTHPADSQPTDRQPLNSGGKGVPRTPATPPKTATTQAIRKNDSAGTNLLIAQVKLTSEDVKRLKAYVDPNTGESCDFPDDPKVQPQLKLLLGQELPHLEDNLRRGSGCWIKNGWLGFDGFQPHNGGQEHGFVSINLDGGAIVAAIFTWTTDSRLMTWSNPKFKIYGITRAYNGDLNTLPSPLADWIKETWAAGIEASHLGGMKKIDANAPPNVELQRSQPNTAAAGPTSGASTHSYIEVSLKEVKDLKGMGTSFPFLKSELDEVIADNKNTASGLGPTTVYFFDLNQKGMPRLFFVAQEGGMVCGSAGCGLTVYMDQGKGFAPVLDALIDVESPIYISKDQLSLLTCGSGGRGEWRFGNDEFQGVPGKPRPSQKLAPCGTRAISDADNADNPVTATARTTTQTSNSGTPTGEIVNEPRVDPGALELSYWESIRNSTDPEDFKAYLVKYPNGQFAELAKLRVRRASPASNPASDNVAAAERARNTHVFEVRDASKTSGSLTVAPGTITFEPRKQKEGKNITIQCSEIKRVEQGQSDVISPHVNLFLTAVNGKERPLVFYTSTGGTGVVGVFVKGLPAKPVVDITANVIRAITEACR